jgi:Zn-dependent protease with chaperone function
VTAVTHLRAVRGQAVRTAQAVRLVGRPEPELGAVLVEHLQPAVYCVAGPHPTVVMTTGALQALDPGQVDAVLAHERAHLACHHHRFLAIARIGRQVFPFIPLMRDAARQVARLAEMHADDAATAGRDTRPLAAALVVLAWAGAGPVPETPALAAAGTDAVYRIQRLLAPAEPLGRVRRHLLRAAAAGLALVPLALALTPAVVALALGRVQPA